MTFTPVPNGHDTHHGHARRRAQDQHHLSMKRRTA